jgi:flagellin-specific chaperone FliS
MQTGLGTSEARPGYDNGLDQSPELLILNLYDLGIQFCAERQKEQARKVLAELINALNFDYADMAASFYNLYHFALNQIEAENYEEALEIFQGLRSAWEQLIPGAETRVT